MPTKVPGAAVSRPQQKAQQQSQERDRVLHHLASAQLSIPPPENQQAKALGKKSPPVAKVSSGAAWVKEEAADTIAGKIGGASEVPHGELAPTTVMLRNIPNRYTQSMLLTLLESRHYDGLYDFVYLPMDFRNGVNLGYAFVNLVRHADALSFMQAFQGFSEWLVDSVKVCETSWAHPHQGLHEHVERYRNSPVMHPRMPDEYKPMVFYNGVRVPFPPPTKAIKAPKLRLSRDRASGPVTEAESAFLGSGGDGNMSGLVAVCA